MLKIPYMVHIINLLDSPTLDQGFLKEDVSASPGNFLEMQTLRPHPKLTMSDSGGAQPPALISPPDHHIFLLN